jgi:hypothetical protein
MSTRTITATLPFFLLQLPAIAFEEVVMWSGRRMGMGIGVGRWIGYVWVLLWLNLCSPTFLDSLIAHGAVEDAMLPFSVWRMFGLEKLVR